MLYVALCKVKAGTMEERIARRLNFQHSEGVRVVAEVALMTEDPEVIIIFETESIAPMMSIADTWNDLYEVNIFPAINMEDALEMFKQAMG